MKYYYLLNGKIMSANENMPNDESMFYKRKSEGENWGDFLLRKWHSSLQPCEISESELEKVKNKLSSIKLRWDSVIEVTDIISDNNGVISFKEKNCQCLKCSPIKLPNFRLNVCAKCGNKRCPHASDHKYKCTKSNEPNQLGSVYCEHPKQVGEIESQEDLISGVKGLTKREYFAGLAMQGLLSKGNDITYNPKDIANYSIDFADSLLTALDELKKSE